MDKILSFIKKYTLFLLPAGILIFALVLFVPTILMGKSLKDKVETSVRQGKKVVRVRNNAHSLKDVEDETSYQDRLQSDADQVNAMAKQSMQRELVSYSIFPEPASSSIQVYINFGKVYRQKIEKLITKANAKSAPTNTEIDQKLNKFGGVIKKTGVAKKKKGSAREDDVYESRKNDYLEQRAQQMSLYASANVFSWYAFWEDYERESIEQAIEDCWFSQVSFWVYEDVIETIRQLNAGSEKVFTSPVKRLIGVNFNKVADYQVSSKANKFVVDTPRYVFKPDAQDLFSTVPLTARACDEEIDVIHFNMAVVVNADSVFSFIQELCKEKDHKFRGYLKKQNTVNYKHNNITVLQYSQEPVELLASEHDRYRYGNSAVVKLNLTCEYIFNRSGYEMIKPASILEKLESDDVKLKKLMKKKK